MSVEELLASPGGRALRDLQAQPVPELAVLDGDREVWAWLVASTGSWTGIPRQPAEVEARESPAESARRIADIVQDAAVEAQAYAGSSPVWPACPRHPGQHPLSAVVEASEAVWTCPRDGVVLAPVGALAR